MNVQPTLAVADNFTQYILIKLEQLFKVGKISHAYLIGRKWQKNQNVLTEATSEAKVRYSALSQGLNHVLNVQLPHLKKSSNP